MDLTQMNKTQNFPSTGKQVKQKVNKNGKPSSLHVLSLPVLGSHFIIPHLF